MVRIYNNIIETIGNTPLVRLNRITEGIEPNIFVKVEAFNPGASVKDRICMAMIEAAEKAKIINKNKLFRGSAIKDIEKKLRINPS